MTGTILLARAGSEGLGDGLGACGTALGVGLDRLDPGSTVARLCGARLLDWLDWARPLLDRCIGLTSLARPAKSTSGFQVCSGLRFWWILKQNRDLELQFSEILTFRWFQAVVLQFFWKINRDPKFCCCKFCRGELASCICARSFPRQANCLFLPAKFSVAGSLLASHL